MPNMIINNNNGIISLSEENLEELEKRAFSRGFEAAKKKAVDKISRVFWMAQCCGEESSWIYTRNVASLIETIKE